MENAQQLFRFALALEEKITAIFIDGLESKERILFEDEHSGPGLSKGGRHQLLKFSGAVLDVANSLKLPGQAWQLLPAPDLPVESE
jgi:hypothetical protein